MKKFVKFLIVVVAFLLFSASCTDVRVPTNVRFQNNSATKTVWPIWDGAKAATLAPGTVSAYMEVNPGTHTIMWKNAANNKDLTTTAWPNLVKGSNYTFPYND